MDIIRHRHVFNPDPFNDEGAVLCVVGAGALGSQVALHLSKLGLNRIQLIDHDVVEAHNLPNQIVYGEDDVGKFKAVALKYALENLRRGKTADNAISAFRAEAMVYRAPVSTMAKCAAVFMCVDSMAAREKISEWVFGHCLPSALLIDGRIGAYSGSALVARVGSETDVRGYGESLYPDSFVAADTGSCGETLSIGATASIIAAQMVWLFMQRFSTAETTRHVNEVLYSVNPWSLMARSF
jgi:molybdopterin/thiamine biosynthesis adenylyltransferase